MQTAAAHICIQASQAVRFSPLDLTADGKA
jgi:hypothetical protein